MAAWRSTRSARASGRAGSASPWCAGASEPALPCSPRRFVLRRRRHHVVVFLPTWESCPVDSCVAATCRFSSATRAPAPTRLRKRRWPRTRPCGTPAPTSPRASTSSATSSGETADTRQRFSPPTPGSFIFLILLVCLLVLPTGRCMTSWWRTAPSSRPRRCLLPQCRWITPGLG